ncbi:hypothetical protein FO440_17510 [Mucilaginibacter corticis]|uniref:Uncharacterized protein n=1 Tax=Mucilaginibacter corticis TaxID=2597670 RepID=A0A556MI41_9SPHI|nr:hypothetical protein [Mucilaginibacter corticis]TSJ39539.1 hypothetical protein FO440_17510 [Mucilaginibacter corticis]
MLKKLLILLFIGSCLGCHKNQQKAGCGTQVCTDIFAIINIKFTDKNGNAITVQNYSVTNLRTHLKIIDPGSTIIDLAYGYYLVADDSAKSQLSTEGDDVLVSATDPSTNQTKTVTLKLSGGCNCHVNKVSGVDTVAFD